MRSVPDQVAAPSEVRCGRIDVASRVRDFISPWSLAGRGRGGFVGNPGPEEALLLGDLVAQAALSQRLCLDLVSRTRVDSRPTCVP